MIAQQATYEIVYNGKNITGDIKPYVIGFTYSDKDAGETDEIEIELEDSAGLWRYEWYPSKGDTITAQILNEGNILACGVFTVDETECSGSADGDTFRIKAIAAGITKKIRTKTSYAHENKTLREIVNTVAAKHGLQVQGSIANIRIGRIDQMREADLKFLHRLASEYGYSFSIRDSKLTFTNIFEIENKAAALTINRTEVTSFAITDKTSNTFQAVKIAYHNPKDKKVVTYQAKEENQAYKEAKADTLEIRIRAENQQQAEIKARVALYRANSRQQEGVIDMPGNVFALAGNNLEFLHAGMFSGLYYIQSSTHLVTRDGGYTTSIEIKRVGLVENSKQKA